MVAKETIVDGRISELTRLAFFATMRCFLFRNFLQLKILWIFSDSNCVLFLHLAGVDEGGICIRLVAPL